ncbi:unnamed protein product [Cyclocybe aegerita]|uniref:NADP-dependent oxidoreductase domain-containing protein n=1 Tax=Cyclocybe aegerita TaxID=1973307 RepID=A0A8S0XP08_CYCAE|nr:unnamed protein product [Cyclocybe aegerita]
MPIRYHQLVTYESGPNSTYEEPKLHSSPGYSSEGPLDVQADVEDPIKTENKRRRRALRFGFLSLLAALYMTFFVAKSFLSGGFIRSCHGKHRIGKHGVHQNATSAKLPTYFTLPSGDKIPAIALGVWRAAPGEVGEAVKAALKVGYRHVDDAWIYGNEREVGEAIRASSVPRKDIWLTSKLWNTFHAPEDVEPALDESLARLGTDYLDLYLIHWPVAFKKGGNTVDFDLTENPYPTWQKLEQMVEKGKVRNIGISNFNIRRIQNLTSNPLKIQPAVNQVELSYWNPQPELVKWSKENGLLLEAYSPLGSAEKVKESLEIPEVLVIAKETGLTPAQVYISWHIQRGTVVLPKSVHPVRVEENFHVAPLSSDAFERLEKAATSHEPFRAVDPHWGIDIWN